MPVSLNGKDEDNEILREKLHLTQSPPWVQTGVNRQKTKAGDKLISPAKYGLIVPLTNPFVTLRPICSH